MPKDRLVHSVWYFHKYNVAQQYGGPEEGGWWYDTGVPTGFTFGPVICSEEDAYAQCRKLNELEHERAKRDEPYGYTSVLSHHSTHYSYDLDVFAEGAAYPVHRPHYE